MDFSSRLAYLEQLAAAPSADSFALYALALEYRKNRRYEEALSTFERLHDRDPTYVPMYLMAGQTLVEIDRPDQAVQWLTQGVEAARAAGDGKALGELSSLLESLSRPAHQED